jgi:hypothetical protein
VILYDVKRLIHKQVLINLLLGRLALSHLILLGSLSVASYDSQGLRWKYSYPPAHGEETNMARILCVTRMKYSVRDNSLS